VRRERGEEEKMMEEGRGRSCGETGRREGGM
jgi:hypothetical protein